ncbi:MAG: hypothetical protein KKC11_03680 [Candidatus Omnitrophica bacterium]|nr:hypothetical protein [Candidatus Omnitrophota bacterium]MBU1134748.1 hypothetical protein [Candidatus Omnitrophota bacterium]MBU1366510.1 hypothetical protein [Candidatus Omnitrophota bacterium]MBU1524657.1 hypothetical protein [Candidatus Omnitrophota bacterium]
MKKKGLGLNPLDNLIPTPTKQPATEIKPIKPLKSKTLKPLNFKDCEKLLVSIRSEQLEFLERLSKKIMKDRSPEYREKRITKNTLFRVAIDVLKEVENSLDTTNIPNESVLYARITELFRIK